MSAFALISRPIALRPTFGSALGHTPFCSPIRQSLRRSSLASLPRTATPLKVTMARRQRIDPSDEAFVTCPTCGSDEITSAANIVRKGTAVVTCSQCKYTWTARAVDALTITGSPLVNHDTGSASDEQDEDLLRSLGVKLYISGLGPKVDSIALKAALEEFGDVRDARIVYDKVTGRSRGFGFATMVGKSAASAAIDVLSGDSSTSLGRHLKVREATD